MTTVDEITNLQIEKSKKMSDYQKASDRFDLLVERGLASKRTPIEIGRSKMIWKDSAHGNSKELRK